MPAWHLMLFTASRTFIALLAVNVYVKIQSLNFILSPFFNFPRDVEYRAHHKEINIRNMWICV